ncbi:MAG: succinate dehydrogenase/fumarate reductase iron-sulfur subunit [Gemmataceae bacterium]|nr:succinate dehydrogenase/fumarate reductase iron-sulfur subunit [Gemmataceae bacterium]
MNLVLHIWRQKNRGAAGELVEYRLDVSPDCSFLEMLDLLNEDLIRKGQEPVAFDYDCREGICGTCGVVVNGVPHGPVKGATTCQVHMRNFRDGEHIYIEPFRAKGFPVIKDLVVDRSAFDRIIQSGGYVSCNTGGAPDGNAVPISHVTAEAAMDAAACIGCGACVAACKNASAMLFVSAKVTQLAMLPQGQPERAARAKDMVEQHDRELFGGCTNQYECEAVCPKEISVKHIAALNREYVKSTLAGTK